MEYIHRRQNGTARGGTSEAACQDSAFAPNSSFAAPLDAPGGWDGSALEAAMQAKLSALQRQIPAAEAEADRLAEGVTATSPEELKQEMGGRLGADFSSVRFHSDPSSAQKADWMGARAWTQGSDVYFGDGGFEPSVAAHELVHTVQQGAVSGTVSQSAPAGEVQMKPALFSRIGGWFKRKFGKQPSQGMTAESIDNAGAQILKMAGTLDGPNAGPDVEPDIAVNSDTFANIEAAKRMLEELNAPSALAPEAGPAPANQQQPKRPWEMGEEDFQSNPFNPGGSEEVARHHADLDNAQTARDAYRIFADFVGNSGCGLVKLKPTKENPFGYETWNLDDEEDLDLDRFKSKLKNMSRMVWDYPELRGNIGNMEKTGGSTSMAAVMSTGPRNQRAYNLQYNSSMDQKGVFSSISRFFDHVGDKLEGHRAAEDSAFDGTHELGHVLNYLLLSENNKNAWEDYDYATTASDFLKTAVGRADPNLKLAEYKKDSTDKNKKYKAGQVDVKKSGLHSKGMTSGYGETNATEFFAEAFADVYAHGKNARKASIELVKEFETRRAPLLANNRKLGGVTLTK